MPYIPKDFKASRVFGVEDLQELSEIIATGDFTPLETALVKPDTRVAPKKWDKDLTTEWTMLLRQYGEGTALSFAVPMLTPLVRRKIDFTRNFALYHSLFQQYEKRLLKELSSRWLVSVADTFITHPRNAEEEAWGFAAAFFMKTIKLYETEELRLKSYPDLGGPIERVDVEAMEAKHGRVMLFDGIQPFNLGGYGDMIEKMRHRLNASPSTELSYKVMRELFDRVHEKQTVYKRIDGYVQRYKK